MSKEGDKKNYAEAAVVQAFQKLYTKETNHHEHNNTGHGVAVTANATCDDIHRFINITIRIDKDGE